MIEFVYRENAKETEPEQKLELPRNVRQIGEPEENRKIYIEDYVITYLKKFAAEETLSSRIAVLLGSSERMGGVPYLFIRSAVGLEELEYTEGGIPFTDEVWAQVYGAIKEYFPEQDILGWFLSVPGYPLELDSGLSRIHVNYFGGVDKVLMVEEPSDGDEDFFAYENGKLSRQRGYYIFYERNEAMQRYMVDHGGGESVDEKEEFEDRAMKSFRTIVQEKKEISGQKKVLTFLYTASTFLVMVVLVIGVTLINNYEKMEGLEMALSELSRSLENENAEIVTAYSPEGADDAAETQEQSPEESVPSEKSSQPEESTPQEKPVQSEEPSQPEESAPQEKPAQSEEPSQPEESAPVQSAVPESYVVQEGDTLLKISRRIYGRDDRIEAICSMNGIDDSDRILTGQKLLLPQ